MTHALIPLGPLCRALPAPAGAGLFAAALLGGLGGGFFHCALMCGPFVIAEAGGRMAALPPGPWGEAHRWRLALLPAWHGGRLLTYAALGAAAGGAGGLLFRLPGLHLAQSAALLAAGLLFAAEALALLRPVSARPSWLPAWPGARRGGCPRRGFWRGLLLGFLPCGLLYAALSAAAAAGSAGRGALVMAAFGAGTLPALIAAAALGPLFGRRLAAHRARLFAPLLLLDALLLITLGLAEAFA